MDELAQLRHENIEKVHKIESLVQETEFILNHIEQIEKFQDKVVSEANLQSNINSKVDKEDASLLFNSSRGATTLDRAKNSLIALNYVIPDHKENMAGMVEDIEEEIRRQEAAQRRRAHTPSIRPAAGVITSPFGYRQNPVTGARHLHSGGRYR